MRNSSILNLSPASILFALLTTLTSASPALPHSLTSSSAIKLSHSGSHALSSNNVTIGLFADLEEFSRIVDISYCVGTTGITYPFLCAGRCQEFPSFELVGTFNTGVLMSDSCGFVVVDHGKGGSEGKGQGRIIVAFRGTYSLANTIVDLSTVPQEYVPYPEDPGDDEKEEEGNSWWRFWGGKEHGILKRGEGERKCENCTVHMGFWTSWKNTRPFVVPHVKEMKEKYPNYQVHLVGHSLGGAVAALAGLEIESLGWKPIITTFGEPRIGNEGLRDFLDESFGLDKGDEGEMRVEGRYRRMTHVDDPVPLLPLQEWGYRQHAGEIYISKASLQPTLKDLHLCQGDDDVECLAGADTDSMDIQSYDAGVDAQMPDDEQLKELSRRWGIPIPSRYKMWQLFFAHRDYFWRLGLCVPGGDPNDWGRGRYDFGDGNDNPQ